jgi:hypothetical protein
MSFLATDPKKVNLNPSSNLSSDLTLPKVEKPHLEGGSFKFVSYNAEGELKTDFRNALSNTKSTDLGTNKDFALNLAREKIENSAKKEPTLAFNFDDLKADGGALDQLHKRVQSSGSLDSLIGGQERLQGLVPKSQMKIANTLLEVAETLSKTKGAADKKVLSEVYDKIADILEPGKNILPPEVDRNKLGAQINDLNKQVNGAKLLNEILARNPGRSFNITNENIETLDALVTVAGKVILGFDGSTTVNQKNAALTPFLEKIAESLLSK